MAAITCWACRKPKTCDRAAALGSAGTQPAPRAFPPGSSQDASGDRLDDIVRLKRLVGGIFLLMAFGTVYFARDLLLPVVIGFLLASTLSPLVRGAARFGIPAPVTALSLIFGLIAGMGLAVLLVGGSVAAWVDEAPSIGAQLKHRLAGIVDSVEAMQNASEQVEEITSGKDKPAEKVVVDQPGLLTTAVSNLAALATSVAVGMVLALFLLASGDLFFLKLVQSYPKLTDKKRALKIVFDIERRVSHYLLSITLINMGLGIAIAGAMYLLNVPYWYIWGAAAFALNFLPFLGAVIGAALVGAYAVVGFDSLERALLVPVCYLILTSIEGQLITPWLLGRRLNLNTVAVFLTVIFWGWLWGVPGALMAVPFLVCVKVVCDHVESMHTLGNFLGSEESGPMEESGSGQQTGQ